MIQDIFPQKLHIEYIPATPGDESSILCFRARDVLVKTEEGNVCFPTYQECTSSASGRMSYIYLFRVDDMAYFLAMPGVGFHQSPEKDEGRDTDEHCDSIGSEPSDEADKAAIIPGYHYEDIQVFRNGTPRTKCFAGITAHHLYDWYRNHQYCGRCQNKFERDEKERMLHCKMCGNQLFPKICPAVIVGVTDGDHLLMTRYARSGYRLYSLVAGFIETGESAEDAVKREAMEETGLRVKNIRYYKSQPWGLTESLLMGFYADLDGNSSITVDTTELAEAKWVHRDDIQVEYDGFSLTNEMICYFRDGCVQGVRN